VRHERWAGASGADVPPRAASVWVRRPGNVARVASAESDITSAEAAPLCVACGMLPRRAQRDANLNRLSRADLAAPYWPASPASAPPSAPPSTPPSTPRAAADTPSLSLDALSDEAEQATEPSTASNAHQPMIVWFFIYLTLPYNPPTVPLLACGQRDAQPVKVRRGIFVGESGPGFRCNAQHACEHRDREPERRLIPCASVEIAPRSETMQRCRVTAIHGVCECCRSGIIPCWRTLAGMLEGFRPRAVALGLTWLRRERASRASRQSEPAERASLAERAVARFARSRARRGGGASRAMSLTRSPSRGLT